MADRIIYFVIAFICTANCHSLGQTSSCETPNIMPNLVPSLSGTSLCESSPNIIYPYSLGTIVEPGIMGLGLPYTIGVQPPTSTTAVETCPSAVNVGYVGGLPGLGVPGFGMPGLGVPGLVGYGGLIPGYGLPGVASVGGLANTPATPVCENTPNVVGLGYPYASLGLPNVSPVAATAVYETTTPSVLGLGFNLPLARPFL